MTGLIVVDPGFFTTVQDMGRPGYREWGVPLGGAVDRESAVLANALVGNPPACALLEITIRGGVYVASSNLALALAGAPMDAKIVDPLGSERLLRVPSSFSIEDGGRLVLGRALAGARAYLAVKAGWRTRISLGSRSAEEPISAGDRLPAEPGTIATRHPSESIWRAPTAQPFRLMSGPDATRDGDTSFDSAFWTGRRFRVGSNSDRMGLRLEGETVKTDVEAERLSTPVAPGAIQIAGGQLIVLGVACGTMGGYPHVAHVISADLDRLGQLRPGDMIEFCEVNLAEARALDDQARARRAIWTTRVLLMAHDA